MGLALHNSESTYRYVPAWGKTIPVAEYPTTPPHPITVDGEPEVGAALLFHPVSDPAGVTASGTVREDGTFTLVSGIDKGLVTGKYVVTVSWPDPSVKPTEAQMKMGMAEPGPDLLKGRYATKQGSGLSVEIAADTQQLPPFELEKP